jgi:hypothetical protein
MLLDQRFNARLMSSDRGLAKRECGTAIYEECVFED